MLSYQHSYHAGCLADVHKHAVLCHIIQHMASLPSPMSYIETHAGRGLYYINSPEALKTGEAQAGIVHLLETRKLDASQPLSTVLRQVRGKFGVKAYPGSPLIAQMLLRPHDRISLMELHPQEFHALEKNLRGPNIRLFKEEGYGKTYAMSPPRPPRGFVLIDPSYEVKGEYLLAVEFMQDLLEKWPEAVVLLWYPILKAGNHTPMCEALEEAGLPGFWRQELQLADPETVRGMHGSGLIAINLPAGLQNRLETVKEIFA